MKYLQLAGLVFLINNIISGQEYLHKSCTWKIKDLAYVDLVYFNTDYIDYIDGDTLIEGINYYKLYRKGKSISGFTPTDSMFIHEFQEYKGAILEENKVWYWVEKEATKSTIMYDFNISEGDSITYGESNSKYELILIDSIYHGGMYKKVYELDGSVINLIEGVGWNTRLISPIIYPESISYLQCFNNSGEYFTPDLTEFEILLNLDIEETKDCGESLTVIKDQLVNRMTPRIFPNPFKNKLNIESEIEIEEILILNKMGKLIYNKEGNIHDLEFSYLKDGIYYLVLKSKAGLSSHKLSKLDH